MRDLPLEVMAEKGLGEATLKVERVCALLDPRRKSLDNSQIVNGSAALRTRAEEDLKALIETFADEHTPSPAHLPPSSVVNQETAEPAPKRKKLLEWRRGVRYVWPLQLLVVLATEGPSLCLPSPGGA